MTPCRFYNTHLKWIIFLFFRAIWIGFWSWWATSVRTSVKKFLPNSKPKSETKAKHKTTVSSSSSTSSTSQSSPSRSWKTSWRVATSASTTVEQSVFHCCPWQLRGCLITNRWTVFIHFHCFWTLTMLSFQNNNFLFLLIPIPFNQLKNKYSAILERNGTQIENTN